MFTDTENWEISKLLAAILHLGNLQYEGEGPRWCTPSPTCPGFKGSTKRAVRGVLWLSSCPSSYEPCFIGARAAAESSGVRGGGA